MQCDTLRVGCLCHARPRQGALWRTFYPCCLMKPPTPCTSAAKNHRGPTRRCMWPCWNCCHICMLAHPRHGHGLAQPGAKPFHIAIGAAPCAFEPATYVVHIVLKRPCGDVVLHLLSLLRASLLLRLLLALRVACVDAPDTSEAFKSRTIHVQSFLRPRGDARFCPRFACHGQTRILGTG